MGTSTAGLPRTVAKRVHPGRYRLVCAGKEFICQQWAHSAYPDAPRWYKRGFNWHLSDTNADGSEGYRLASFSLLSYAKAYVSEYVAHQQAPLPQETVTHVDEGTYEIAIDGRTWWLWHQSFHDFTDAKLDLSPDEPWVVMVEQNERAAVWAYRAVGDAIQSCRVDAHGDRWKLRAAELIK